jgi:hypothetical protein
MRDAHGGRGKVAQPAAVSSSRAGHVPRVRDRDRRAADALVCRAAAHVALHDVLQVHDARRAQAEAHDRLRDDVEREQWLVPRLAVVRATLEERDLWYRRLGATCLCSALQAPTRTLGSMALAGSAAQKQTEALKHTG